MSIFLKSFFFQTCYDKVIEIIDPGSHEKLSVVRDDRVHASLLILYELLRVSISEGEESDSSTGAYSQNSSASDKVNSIISEYHFRLEL